VPNLLSPSTRGSIDLPAADLDWLHQLIADWQVIADLSVRENLIIALQAKTGVFKLLPAAKQNELAERYIKALNIKTPSPETLVRQLSGGNQQKVMIGRWLATKPKVLILDEPTRGIDVNARSEFYTLMHEFVDNGGAIIMISSEMPEVIGVSDRVIVMREGRISGELQKNEVDEQNIIMLASITSDAKN